MVPSVAEALFNVRRCRPDGLSQLLQRVSLIIAQACQVVVNRLSASITSGRQPYAESERSVPPVPPLEQFGIMHFMARIVNSAPKCIQHTLVQTPALNLAQPLIHPLRILISKLRRISKSNFPDMMSQIRPDPRYLLKHVSVSSCPSHIQSSHSNAAVTCRPQSILSGAPQVRSPTICRHSSK